jgi:hypothetical protein
MGSGRAEARTLPAIDDGQLCASARPDPMTCHLSELGTRNPEPGTPN